MGSGCFKDIRQEFRVVGQVEDGAFDSNGEDTPLNRFQEKNYFREGEGRGLGAIIIITIEMCGCRTFGAMLGSIGVQMLARSVTWWRKFSCDGLTPGNSPAEMRD
jgi:hypothetical protein